MSGYYQESGKYRPASSAVSASVPKVPIKPEQPVTRVQKTGHWIMLACCVPMVAVAGTLLWSTDFNAEWQQQFAALLPIAICLVAHLFLHKIMGQSCHNHPPEKEQEKK